MLDLIAGGGVHALSHITGGGIAANVARVLPADLHGEILRASWSPPPVFGLIAGLGGVALAERERTFNEGLGMVAVVAPEAVDGAVRRLTERGVPAWVCGQIRSRTSRDSGDAPAKGGVGGTVAVLGEHP